MDSVPYCRKYKLQNMGRKHCFVRTEHCCAVSTAESTISSATNAVSTLFGMHTESADFGRCGLEACLSSDFERTAASQQAQAMISYVLWLRSMLAQ